MHILTKHEYDEMVTETVERVWAPLGDSQDFVFEIADLVDEGHQDEAREKLRARVHDEVAGAARYLTDGEVLFLDDLPPVVHGCIVQHGEKPVLNARRADVAELHGGWRRETPTARLERAAFEQLYVDVRAEVLSRVRSYVND